MEVAIVHMGGIRIRHMLVGEVDKWIVVERRALEMELLMVMGLRLPVRGQC